MNVTKVTPCSPLAPFVVRFDIIESDEEVERTLLPEPCIIIGLRYSGASTLIEGGKGIVLPMSVVTGLRATPRRMRTAAGSGIIVAKLTEMGASAILSGPLHRLFGKSVPLDAYVDPAGVAHASRAIRGATNSEERVLVFERFLLERCRHDAPDRVIVEGLRRLHADPSGARIARLARSLGMSQDAFEKRFRRVVGATPKAFASILQFRRALDAYSAQSTNLTELAVDAGFYDQSHLNRRFRSAAGAAPGSVFGSTDYC